MATSSTKADKSAAFWDRIAEKYANRPVDDEEAYQRKLAITREHFRSDMEVLELGCGTGSTALVHAPHVKRLHAVDVSSAMLAIAEEKTKDAGVTNLTFECSSIDNFNAPDGSYDMVLALSLLHLLKDRDAAIAKIRRVLKPGGLFVSSTACLGDRMPFFALIGPIGQALGAFPYVSVFKERAFVEEVAGAGFEIEHQWRPEKSHAVFLIAKKA